MERKRGWSVCVESVKLWLERKQETLLSTVGVIFPCLKVNSDKSELQPGGQALAFYKLKIRLGVPCQNQRFVPIGSYSTTLGENQSLKLLKTSLFTRYIAF